MAKKDRGIIVWVGDRGRGRRPHMSRNTFRGPLGMTELGAIATGLEDFTKCNVAARILSQESDLGNTTPPGVGANIDKRGVYVLRDDETGQEIEVIIACISDALIDTSAPEGDRILPSDVELMASQVATATGKTISPIYGYVLGLE